MNKTVRTAEEWAVVEQKIDELVKLGFSQRKACDYVGVKETTYTAHMNAKRDAEAEDEGLESIAYELEGIGMKLDKLIEIGNGLLSVWQEKPKTNSYGKADAEKVERELGIHKFPDSHHL